jgi:uncharacterized protein
MNTFTSYPTIRQSIGASAILIGGMLMFSPVSFLMVSIIGKEASTLLYYVLAVGIPYLLINNIRKQKTSVTTHNFVVADKRVLPYLLIITLGIIYGLIAPLISLIPIPEWFKKILMTMSEGTGIFTFLMLVVAAPVLEELIFRGIILDGLLKKYRPVTAIVVSSVLFGFVHLNPWQFVTGFILGIFMGWVYYNTQSLTLTIFIHFVANFNAFFIRLFMDHTIESMDESLIESYGGIVPTVVIVLSALFAMGVGIYFLNRKFTIERKLTQHAVETQQPSGSAITDNV